MLLFTFTTEGSAAEDGNVYYASQLIVNAEESDHDTVTSDLAEILDGKVGAFSQDVIIKRDAGYTGLFQNLGRAVMELALRGWQAELLKPTFVIHESE